MGLGEGRPVGLGEGRPVEPGEGRPVEPGEGLLVPGDGFPTEPILTLPPVEDRDAGPGLVVPAGAIASSDSGFSVPAGASPVVTDREAAPGPDVEISSSTGAFPAPGLLERRPGFSGRALAFFVFGDGPAFAAGAPGFLTSEAR